MNSLSETDSPLELSTQQRARAMLGVYAVLFLLGLETTIGGSILPLAANELHGLERFPLTGTLQMLASACATPITARLGDMYGRKRLLRGSIALLCLAGIGSAMALSMDQLLAMRVLNGIALGMMAATAFAVPADVFPDPAQRVRWQSVSGIMFALSSSIGPLLGATLSDAFGWRSSLFVVPVVGIPVLMVLCFIPPNRTVHIQPQRFDVLGGGLLCVFIVSSLMALQERLGDVRSIASFVGWWLLCGLVLTSLWRHQLRVAQPILALDILLNRGARQIIFSTLLSGAVLFILFFYSPTLLHTVGGLSMVEAGVAMIPMLVGMPVGSVLNGLLFRRQRRPQRLMALGALLLFSGCGLLSLLAPGSSSGYIFTSFGLCGLGLGVINQNQMLFMQMAAPAQHVGSATGLISTARTYGGALGSALLGLALGVSAIDHALSVGLLFSVIASALLIPLSLRLHLH
ncbi:MFS transporter [Pseudomonas laurylsulfativorans]|uniref:MFS transporter n=1 Tax=Pseudomonas laurylsulfativorans TaxID=1943631 RepID=UPI0013FD43FD|nr:MFS transporter [Pseudomonas laurylsulfativorans]